MSKKIEEQLNQSEPERTVVTLSEREFAHLRHLNQIRGTINFYLEQLQTEFLQALAVDKWEFDPAKQLQFSIDLSKDDKALTIIELPESAA